MIRSSVKLALFWVVFLPTQSFAAPTLFCPVVNGMKGPVTVYYKAADENRYRICHMDVGQASNLTLNGADPYHVYYRDDNGTVFDLGWEQLYQRRATIPNYWLRLRGIFDDQPVIVGWQFGRSGQRIPVYQWLRVRIAIVQDSYSGSKYIGSRDAPR